MIAPQGLGDSLEATPFVDALHAARQDAPIDVLVTRPAARELFGALEDLVRETIYLPYWEHGRAAFVRSLLAARRRPRYEAAFLMYPAARSEYHVLARAMPARKRYAHAYWPVTPRNLLWLYDTLVFVERKHNVLRNLDLLDAAGIAHGVPDRYVLPKSWTGLQRRDPRAIAIHAGTIAHDGLESRRWPLENFIAAARAMADDGRTVYAISGPAEREATQQLARAVPGTQLVEKPLPELARFLGSVGAVLSNDSGIGHLAAAAGAPTVALFGPTPLEHAPYGPSVRALRPSLCAPCFDVRLLNTQCALNIDYACLKRDLPVETVVRALRDAAQASAA